MDNGVLVFIIIALGVVIVWQASKLTQYRRFEEMTTRDRNAAALRSRAAPAPAAPSSVASGAASDGAPAAGRESVPVGPATTPTDPRPARESVGQEAHLEEAKAVQQVMARCRYAEFYLDQLDDDYEREEFRRIVDESIRLTTGITDPLLAATALEPLILLLDAAEWNERRDALVARIADPVVRRRVTGKLESAALDSDA